MYTISEWLTELWRWKQRTRTTLLKSYTRRKRERSPQKIFREMWNKKEIRKRILREPRNKSKLFNQCHATLAVSIPGNRSKMRQIWQSPVYISRSLAIGRVFCPGPEIGLPTHPGPDELTASKRGLWRILDLKSCSRPLQDFDYRPCYFQLIDLRSKLFATYWSLPEASCNLLVSGSSDRVAARLLCQIPCNGGSPRTQTGICWKRFSSISISDFPHCRSRDGFPDSRLGRISRFPDLISGISRPWPLEHSRGGGVWPAAQQPRWPRPAFHCKEHQTSPSYSVRLYPIWHLSLPFTWPDILLHYLH